MKHINHQIRNILKCDFVDKIIISNHNPGVQINTLISVRDERLIIVNQDERRGCGHRWSVAAKYSPEYLIVVDDDILLFPWQLQSLFKHLVEEPGVPHGYAGMLHHPDGSLEYREVEERSVDYLCEIYALTRSHLKQFHDLRRYIVKTDSSLESVVENSADFVVISRTGAGAPRIHRASRLFRCPTYDQAGVAVHKDADFESRILDVAQALR